MKRQLSRGIALYAPAAVLLFLAIMVVLVHGNV